ncbi:alpha/beta hydrolase [Marinifilum caeruleilacunae]|uniref:Alpha/beta fold hydrolase n=1 Tax=Marinifilum caeruleilacunae TaxID=2499076 RepID=A0ABX1WRC4_9BACT|nr:alpha/beta fold hydrolase [Marinifilum caeruleilacunae]NOU58520.1 alpha/beta fold hydrolase [Marinifilum caeruleilacunae]
MKKVAINTLKIALVLYVAFCAGLYFLQENFIFFPEKLEADHSFHFTQKFEELEFNTADGINLHGLLFKADSAKGVIFYLHGNGGSLRSWGNVAQNYTSLNYDVLMLDYRGYGKSEGEISGQEQLYTDNQLVYDELKKIYKEEDIVVLGYSIGTGLAAKLASDNLPARLILQAPYYSLTDMMRQRFSFVPTFLLKYKFATNEYLKNCSMPVTIFHGKDDRVISYQAAVQLRMDFPDKVELISLENQGHNQMTDHPKYQSELKRILTQ